jgi:hypothetical protein
MANPERFDITIETTGHDDRPAETRLKALLKHALRSLGLKCVTIRRTPSEAKE